MRLKSAGKAPRHRLWSKEQFLDDLRKIGDIGKACSIYLLKDQKVGALRSDVWRWRKADKEYDAKVVAVLAEKGTDRPNAGRPPLDAGDKSWQEDFCVYLIRYNWAYDKAAAETPYSLRAIQDKLNPVCSSYDAEFASKVEAAEMVMASRAHEVIVEGLDKANYETFDDAKIMQTRLWAAHKAAEKLNKKFSRKQIEISGNVSHQHQHRLMAPEERLALLWEDRKRFMEGRAQKILLPSSSVQIVSEQEKEDTIEGVVIEEDGE